MTLIHLRNLAGSATLLAAISLQGCALPEAGPSVAHLQQTPGITLVKVTVPLVEQMERQASVEHRRTISAAIASIAADKTVGNRDHLLTPGDTVHVSLWSFSDGTTSSDLGSSASPRPIDVGTFEIASDGTIDLPYVHHVRVSGLTLPRAQDMLTNQYKALGTIQNPAIVLTRAGSNANGGASDIDGVIVTGATGKPTILPWNSGGMTMARALTLALGDGTSVMGAQQTSNGNSGDDESAASVTVSRKNSAIATLPMMDALEQDIELQPADHLILRRQASLHITVVGGGVTHQGLYGFADNATLAQALATSQGMNPNTADDREIYIFRQSNTGAKPTLYQFSTRTGLSMFVAQRFPLADKDVLYVSEAPIVPVMRAMSIIFQAGIIGSLAK